LLPPGTQNVALPIWTPVKGTGRSTWTVTLEKGKYVYSSITHPGRKKTLKVT
jgi:hypothetical protein